MSSERIQRSTATIADVAKLAGVSLSTVSRALNGKPDIAEETRVRIETAVNELGYVPHSQARRLKAGASRTVALLDPITISADQPIDQVHLDFMIGAASAAAQKDYFFNVVAVPITEETLLELYRSVQIDGAILMEIYQNDPRVDFVREHGFPFVMIGRLADNEGLSFIDLDLSAAAERAFTFLVELGHEHIAFLGFPEQLRKDGYGPAVRGWAGHQSAIQRLSLSDIHRETLYTTAGMAVAMGELLDIHPELTAVVALADAPLVGVFSALRERGLAVPEDVSVVGLAVDRIAELMTPRLTAIHFPSEEMGFQATSMLIEQLEGKANSPTQVVLSPDLVVRDTTGPPNR